MIKLYNILDVKLEINDFRNYADFYTLTHEFKDKAITHKRHFLSISIKILNNKLK